jgi:hypothetical protein
MDMLKQRSTGDQMLVDIQDHISMFNIARMVNHHGRDQLRKLMKILMKLLHLKLVPDMKFVSFLLTALRKLLAILDSSKHLIQVDLLTSE